MKTSYGIILILMMAALVTLSVLPCSAQRRGEEKKEEKKEDIWAEEGPRGPGQGRGPGRGPRRSELTDEAIEHIMKDLKESDPAKAKELAKLREEEPEKFKAELGKVVREQFSKRIREHMDMRRHKWRAEFLEWLGENYPSEAKKLVRLKEKDPEEKDPELYIAQFDLIRKRVGYIFEAWRRNPELGEVLKEKAELKEKRDRLLGKIKAAGNDREKEKLIAQLEEVVGNRFDLMVREKQIAYEQLRKRLEELKKRVEQSQAEVDKLMDAEFKNENVKARVEELMSRTKRVKWD